MNRRDFLAAIAAVPALAGTFPHLESLSDEALSEPMPAALPLPTSGFRELTRLTVWADPEELMSRAIRVELAREDGQALWGASFNALSGLDFITSPGHRPVFLGAQRPVVRVNDATASWHATLWSPETRETDYFGCIKGEPYAVHVAAPPLDSDDDYNPEEFHDDD